MAYISEFLIVLFTAFIAWRIFRRKFAENLVSITMFLASWTASALVGLVVAWIASWFTANFVLKFILCGAFGTAVFIAAAWLMSRWVKSNDHEPIRRLEKKMNLSLWLDRTFNSLLFSGCVIFLFVLVLIIVNALSAAFPGVDDSVREHSIALKLLLPPRQESIPPYATVQGDSSSEADIDSLPPDPARMQDRLLFKFRKGWRDMREAVADKTGATAIRDYIQAMQELTNLEYEEYKWLVETNPSLKQLVNYPPLVRLLHNEEVMALLEKIAGGSISAIYEFGDRPEVQALVDDPKIREAIANINIIDLRNQVRERRLSGRKVDVDWILAVLDSASEMNEALKTMGSSKWTTYPSKRGALDWNSVGRFGLAVTTFISTKPLSLTARIYTDASPTAWLNNKKLEFKQNRHGYECRFDLPAGRISFLLLMDFRGMDEPMRCPIDIFLSDH